ncbi:hypothetical protein C8R45DRAFT_1167821 [Mycena sanguinolenta]|nr:hypothetical protein C8R45DRAFT_1167821 [Mycena sanguinolenta]
MGRLPQELVDTIVGLVAGRQSLIVCGLTARSFVEASQRCIFRWLSIQDIPTYELVAGVLTESPHLGQYVRLLSLRIVDIPARWAALESILSTTTRVERLTIEGDRGGFKREARLCANPSLIDFLSSELLLCVGPVNLEAVPESIVAMLLSTCEERKKSSARFELQNRRSRARSMWHLDVMDCDGVMVLLTLPRQLVALQSLTHRYYGERLMRNTLLATCAPRLHGLRIQFSLPFDLVLTHLGLRLGLHASLRFVAIPTAVFRVLQATPHLKKLKIAIHDRVFNWEVSIRTAAPEWLVLEKRLLDMNAQEQGDDAAGVKNSKLLDVHFSLRYLNDDPEHYKSFVA